MIFLLVRFVTKSNQYYPMLLDRTTLKFGGSRSSLSVSTVTLPQSEEPELSRAQSVCEIDCAPDTEATE